MMGAGRIVLLIFGILITLVSIGLIIGGSVTLALENAFKDSEGYYSTGNVPVSSSSPAVVTEPADIELDGSWVQRNPDLVVIRVAADSNTSQPVFIGIAPQDALDDYLQGVAYDRLTNFKFDSSQSGDLQYTHTGGANTAASPTQENFWVASAKGTGEQTLQWNVSSGRYAIVLMNEDGKGPVSADVKVGVKIPDIVRNIGLGLLIGGIVLLIVGGVMIFFAVRGFGTRPPAQTTVVTNP